MKRLHLELAASRPWSCWTTSTEDYARTIGFGAVLTHCGQGCAIPTRLLLPEKLLDAYVEGVHTRPPAIKVGNPLDPRTTLGPLIREQQRPAGGGPGAVGRRQGAEVCAAPSAPRPRQGLLLRAHRAHRHQRHAHRPGGDLRARDDGDPVLRHRRRRRAHRQRLVYGLAGGVVAANTGRAFNVARQHPGGHHERPGHGHQRRSSTAAPATARARAGARPWAASGRPGPSAGSSRRVGREWGDHGFEAFTEVKTIRWA